MAEKKISFGFSKSIKPKILSGITASKNDDNIELIQCLEGQTIKIIGEVKKEEKVLVIPLKNSTKTSAALAALQALKDTLEGNETTAIDKAPQKIDNNDDPKTLEQRAAREILNSLGEHQELDAEKNKIFSLPLKSDELPLDGASEPTMNDYEDIPISQFGLAMLRGMGYKDEAKSDKKKIEDEPMVRPKGMGLGADKMVKPQTLLVAPAKDEVLEIKKGACVRILFGKQKDLYGQIESLDDHSGRLLVKLALGGKREWFNEFMVQPVSKAEYAQYGKVLNSAKYVEYKKKQEEKEQMERLGNLKAEKAESSTSKYNTDRQDRQRQHISSDDERSFGQVESSSSSKHRSSKDKQSNHSVDVDRISNSRAYKRDPSEDSTLLRSNNNSSHKQSTRKTYSQSSDESDDDSRRNHSSSHKSSHKKTKSKKHFKSRSYSKDHRHRYDSSDEDEKYHKKKTKKSKRPRSRSRDRQ